MNAKELRELAKRSNKLMPDMVRAGRKVFDEQLEAAANFGATSKQFSESALTAMCEGNADLLNAIFDDLANDGFEISTYTTQQFDAVGYAVGGSVNGVYVEWGDGDVNEETC